LPVLLKLVQEVVMILGGSVAVGGAIGGAVGSLAFGVGAGPGVMVGGGIGLQVGNLILMGLGLAAIAEYFCEGLPACLSTLQEGLSTASWGINFSWRMREAVLDNVSIPHNNSIDTIMRSQKVLKIQ